MKHRQFLRLLAAGVLTALAPAAFAQASYPTKSIKLIVPYPPGSGTDTVARYTATRLEGALKQSVVVENRPGGNAIIAAQAVINAPADGYTLLWAANGPVTTNVALYEKLPYDPLKDLKPVARVAFSPMGLFVPAGSAYKSADSLLEATKSNPGKLTYASGSATYSIAHEWLLSLVGGGATGVSYKGSAPAVADVAAGLVDFTIVEMSAAMALLQAQKIRLLAVTSDRRMAAFPDVPTLQETGYRDYFQVAWWGVFAPSGTPPAAAATLERTLLEIYSDSETKEFLSKNNYSAFLGSAEELRKFQEGEIKRESRLVTQFKIPRM